MKSGTDLIIVDVQAAFPVPPALVARIERHGRTFRRRIFTQFVNPPGSFFRTQLGRDTCAPGSPDTRLLIAPREKDLVLRKTGYGLTTAHLARLRRLGVRRVEVCGIDTDACVLAAMFALFDAQIEARVVPALCWSAQDLHGEAMRIIKAQFLPPRLTRGRPARSRGRRVSP